MALRLVPHRALACTVPTGAWCGVGVGVGVGVNVGVGVRVGVGVGVGSGCCGAVDGLEEFSPGAAAAEPGTEGTLSRSTIVIVPRETRTYFVIGSFGENPTNIPYKIKV
jgi:hypothetical protein